MTDKSPPHEPTPQASTDLPKDIDELSTFISRGLRRGWIVGGIAVAALIGWTLWLSVQLDLNYVWAITGYLILAIVVTAFVTVRRYTKQLAEIIPTVKAHVGQLESGQDAPNGAPGRGTAAAVEESTSTPSPGLSEIGTADVKEPAGEGEPVSILVKAGRLFSEASWIFGLLIWAGIILVAVGVGWLLHGSQNVGTGQIVALVGGPGAFVVVVLLLLILQRIDKLDRVGRVFFIIATILAFVGIAASLGGVGVSVYYGLHPTKVPYVLRVPEPVVVKPPPVPHAMVPSVVTAMDTSATNRIFGAGFAVSISSVASSAPPGQVVMQSPGGNSLAPKGSVVTIDISRIGMTNNECDLPPTT